MDQSGQQRRISCPFVRKEMARLTKRAKATVTERAGPDDHI